MEDVQVYLKMYESRVEEERLQGVKKLSLCKVESFLPTLYRALGDTSWRVRKEATEVFLQLPQAGALSSEVIEFLHSQDNAGLRNAAVEILVRLGRQSVPSLLTELSCHDHDVRKFILDILGEIRDESTVGAMVGMLKDPDINVRAAAAENLGKLRAAESVPALLDTMQDADLTFRFTILEALGQIGVPVEVDRLVLYKNERLLRKALYDCLGLVGGEEAIPTLIEGLSDNMRNVREAAAVALSAVARQYPVQVEQGLKKLAPASLSARAAEMLHNGRLEVREAALKLLGWIADPQQALVLLGLFDDEQLRESAAAALLAMGPNASQRLLEAWPQSDARTRTYMAYVFGETGDQRTLGLLTEGITAEDPELKMMCAQALGRLGCVTGVPILVGALRDAFPDVREMAMRALCALAITHRDEVIDALHPLLEDEEPEIRMYVVMVVGQMSGSDVVDCLTFAMKDESPDVRRAALRAFEGRAMDQEMIGALMLALTDEDTEVRQMAAEVLGMTGDLKALSPLELAMRDEDIWVRSAAVRALGRLGGEQAFALVRQALGDPVGLVAISALETLAEMDFGKAYDDLVLGLSHADEEVVTAAINILGRGRRRDWIDAVAGALINHRYWDVRATFARTAVELGGDAYAHYLEERLAVEEEDLVRHQLRDLLEQLKYRRCEG